MSLHDVLYLYSTRELYTIVPANGSTKGIYINRLDGNITMQDSNSLVRAGEPISIYGLVGVLNMKLDKYLIVATQRRHVARIDRDDIYQITNFEVLPTRLASLKMQTNLEELQYVNLVRTHLRTGPFYYSPTGDITNSLQKQAKSQDTNEPLWKRANDMFFWNKFAQSELIASIGRDPDSAGYIVPMIYGYLSFSNVVVNKAYITFGIISRRGRYRAGTRYFSRGIDPSGHVSNFNETEQIALVDGGSKGVHEFSYIQTRGSVPVKWAEINDLKYKPKLKVSTLDLALEPARKHFANQYQEYGDQYIVNLVNSTGYEKPVKLAYERLVSTLSDDHIHYTYFDFHQECKGMRWDRVQILIDQLLPELLKQSYFHCKVDELKTIVSRQTSVVRTNCMDCLDRTNVVQSCLARWVLARQLQACGVLSETENIAGVPQLEYIFRNAWADNANSLSKAYSGTGALKTDFTRSGVRTRQGLLMDGYNSLSRYLLNNFFDGPRQDAYDLFLGNFDPSKESTSENPFVDQRPIYTQMVPFAFFLALFMLLVGLILPRKMETRLPFSLYVILWLIVMAWALFNLNTYGMTYVNWPRLVRLDWLEEQAIRHGAGSTGSAFGRARELESGKKRVE